MPVPPMHYIKLYTDEAVRKEQVPRFVHRKMYIKVPVIDFIEKNFSRSEEFNLWKVEQDVPKTR